jgi:hypothetical protein
MDFRKFCVLILLLLALLGIAVPTRASSQQAYTDYNFQFDQYRQKFADFRIAYTQYQQFNSLTSQQDALDKAKAVIAQRDIVARTYLLFLNERLNENPGLLKSETQVYRAIITNEIGFLDNHSTQVPSLNTLEDTAKSSDAFVKNYETLQSAYHQTIVALEMGYLNYFATQFDAVANQAIALITANKSTLPPVKQATLDRWLLSLSNKRSLYQQKITAIRTASFALSGDQQEQDQKFLKIQSDLGVARQYLVDAVNNVKEVEKELQNID